MSSDALHIPVTFKVKGKQGKKKKISTNMAIHVTYNIERTALMRNI